MLNSNFDLIARLDLSNFIESFLSFFAREKPLFLEGDYNRHIEYIKELETLAIDTPPHIANLTTELTHIKKFGTLRCGDIYEFVKIVNYFKYLKSLKLERSLKRWIDEINIPEQILDICKIFSKDGEIKEGIYLELDSVNRRVLEIKKERRERLYRIVHNNKLTPYLVDNKPHLIDGDEALLLRAGFNHLLKGVIVGRSSSGFFYVVPESIEKLKEKEREAKNQKEKIVYNIEKEISSLLNKNYLFLKFINREFDRFDHYQARVAFAKSYNLEFLKPKSDKSLYIKDFKHPAISKAKSVTIDCSKKIVLITGVNAGGKTMLLKSILSVVYLSKHLIPMKIDAYNSSVGNFKEIRAILEDPQNVKDDISTFAGRMVGFSELFTKNSLLVGVDEIELGTDADEAASLFKVILEKLICKDTKIIITTHHKRLASLMAINSECELIAALYDEKNQKPTFSFLQGTIGKSYAFETALRYGIPKNIVDEAKVVYGEDRERLNELIEKSSKLELELNRKGSELDSRLKDVENLKTLLSSELEESKKRAKCELDRLQSEYKRAIDEAKDAAKKSSSADIHRALNSSHEIVSKIDISSLVSNITSNMIDKEELKVGDRAKYRKTRGVVLSLSSKYVTLLSDENIKLKLPRSDVKRVFVTPRAKKVEIFATKPNSAQVKLDLHGQRVDEAIDCVDKFISDSLMAGFDEVLIYHGIGSGKLAHAIKEYLSEHPKVVEFLDAPPSLGGFGAKIVRL